MNKLLKHSLVVSALGVVYLAFSLWTLDDDPRFPVKLEKGNSLKVTGEFSQALRITGAVVGVYYNKNPDCYFTPRVFVIVPQSDSKIPRTRYATVPVTLKGASGFEARLPLPKRTSCDWRLVDYRLPIEANRLKLHIDMEPITRPLSQENPDVLSGATYEFGCQVYDNYKRTGQYVWCSDKLLDKEHAFKLKLEIER